MTEPEKPTLALRLADDDDTRVVRRIAALDDAATLRGEVLLALVDGEAVAARSLADGRVVANPFVRTADVVKLLDIRASQLAGAPPRRPRGRGPHRLPHRPAA